jgi:DUF1365 family protein
VIGSSLCVGSLVHHRMAAPEHRFTYALYMLLLDLDELPDLDRRLRLFGHNRSRPIAFRDTDHLGVTAVPLREKVAAFLRAQGIEPPGGRILLLTHPRIFGYVFNPVSFFYCYDRAGVLRARVAEVHNTFGDRHAYADRDSAWSDKKVMHVSPFFSTAGSYLWQLPEPNRDRVLAHVGLRRDGHPLLQASLTLRPEPLTDRGLAWALIRYPLMTLKVVAAIHWEALRLWRKGAPVFPNPGYNPESARGEVA